MRRQYPWLTRGRAIAATFVGALLVVFIWPGARRIVELVTIATIAAVVAVTVFGLTFWAKARVQIGRRKLRYREVRRRSAIAALLGLSFLAARLVSIRIGGAGPVAPDASTQAGEFVVGVARFQNDEGRQVETAIIDGLKGLDRRLKVDAVSLDLSFPPGPPTPQAFKAARDVKAGSLIYGSVTTTAGQRIVKLYIGGIDSTEGALNSDLSYLEPAGAASTGFDCACDSWRR